MRKKLPGSTSRVDIYYFFPETFNLISIFHIVTISCVAIYIKLKNIRFIDNVIMDNFKNGIASFTKKFEIF